MSRHYYYFAATLPSLQLGAPAPFSSAEFLEQASRHLNAEELYILEASGLLSAPELASSPPLAFLRAYYEWERSLRNELTRLRARRLGRGAEPWLRSSEREESSLRAAQAAFAADSPLEGELVIERERWAFINSLKSYHSFDLESLAAYRLQLQILERLARLRAEAGEEGYRKIYADILEPAQSSDMTGVPR